MLDYFINGEMDTATAIIFFLAFTIVFVFALVVHEFAHAFAAVKQGDETPRVYGRVTLNPVAHLDLWGTISFLVFGFGWARPVPVNPLNFKRYRKGIAIVSLAGVFANFLMCFIFSLLFVLVSKYLPLVNYFNTFLYHFTSLGVSINAMLIFLNLIPIYPLDGFNYISTLLKPDNKYITFNYRYGYIMLLLLMLLGVVGIYIMFFSGVLSTGFISLFSWIFGV